MAWEVTAFCLFIIVLLIAVAMWAINAGLNQVRCMGHLSKTVRAQRKKISELGSEIMGLRAKLMESRIENIALRSRLEDLQRQLGAMENKLKAANLIIEQNNARINRRTAQ